MEPKVFAAQTHQYLLTDAAMEQLQKELARDRLLRSVKCDYCGAQPEEPCFTRRGHLLARYHVSRMLAAKEK